MNCRIWPESEASLIRSIAAFQAASVTLLGSSPFESITSPSVSAKLFRTVIWPFRLLSSSSWSIERIGFVSFEL